MNKILLLIFLLLLCFSAQAQKKPSNTLLKDSASIKVIASVQKEAILLRWAPTTAFLWSESNKYGYTVERYTVSRVGKLLDRAEKKVISSNMRPKPLAEWEALVKREKIAGVAAQAIYGAKFKVDAKNNSDLVSIINQIEERENRFSFALFAADMSKEVADYSGIYLEDKNIQKTEQYFYKIYPNKPNTPAKPNQRRIYPDNMVIDTGLVFVDPSLVEFIPPIKELSGDFKDKTATLSWDYGLYEKIFSAYWIERAEDKKTFVRLNNTPFVSLTPIIAGPKSVVKIAYYTDSLKQNGKPYQYRIRGITPFGMVSAPSDTVSGEGYLPLQGNPEITSVDNPENKFIEIKWTYPASYKAQVEGFHVERAMQVSGDYKVITPKILPKTDSVFVDKKPVGAAYYRIKALGVKEAYSHSLARLGYTIDSFPPMPPKDLKGVIDSLGRVTITWKRNDEPDLYGYRVFRSNFKEHEFSQLTKKPVLIETYKDTISIKTLTKKVFYSIVAVDKNFNPSGFSQALEIKRPDIIPPSAPLIYTYKASEQGVYLRWHKSSSDDVVKHILYRNLEGVSKFTTLAVFSEKDSSFFMDKTCEKDKYYQYVMIAVDDANLESKPSPPVVAKKLNVALKEPIKVFEAQLNTELKKIVVSWNYSKQQTKEDKVEKYEIYKAEKGQNMRLLAAIRPELLAFEDENIKVGHTYQYTIKAVFEDGTETKFCKNITIAF